MLANLDHDVNESLTLFRSCPNHYLLALSFQCSDAHRDLHSFPTRRSSDLQPAGQQQRPPRSLAQFEEVRRDRPAVDRKSTRLNSSHEWISYAVFCLKKKK